ncbi:MAG TPA: gluconokinase [Dermatophilaceae bacterium]|nr:gluconokinase [Dermatophilaceae bacterium]
MPESGGRGPAADRGHGAPVPDVVVVMGVSGVGKTTVAKAVAAAMGWSYAEGDDFHPQANVEKMRAGTPLTDADRWPWLRAIGGWVSQEVAGGHSGVVTCSALRRTYRDLLRRDRPSVRFAHLVGSADLITGRLRGRTGHHMPPSLLPSQFATLEPLEPDELAAGSVEVSVEGTVVDLVERALGALALSPVAPVPHVAEGPSV